MKNNQKFSPDEQDIGLGQFWQVDARTREMAMLRKSVRPSGWNNIKNKNNNNNQNMNKTKKNKLIVYSDLLKNDNFELKEEKNQLFLPCLEFNPNTEQSQLSARGIRHRSKTNFQNKIRDCTQKILKNGVYHPTTLQHLMDRGFSYMKIKDHVDFSWCIALNPSYDPAYFNRAVINVKLNQEEKALDDLTEAIRLNPSEPQYYYNRARTYLKLREYGKATTDFIFYHKAKDEREKLIEKEEKEMKEIRLNNIKNMNLIIKKTKEKRNKNNNINNNIYNINEKNNKKKQKKNIKAGIRSLNRLKRRERRQKERLKREDEWKKGSKAAKKIIKQLLDRGSYSEAYSLANEFKLKKYVFYYLWRLPPEERTYDGSSILASHLRSWFPKMSKDMLIRLCAGITMLELSKDTVIVEPNVSLNAWFIILEGSVEIWAKSKETSENLTTKIIKYLDLMSSTIPKINNNNDHLNFSIKSIDDVVDDDLENNNNNNKLETSSSLPLINQTSIDDEIQKQKDEKEKNDQWDMIGNIKTEILPTLSSLTLRGQRISNKERIRAINRGAIDKTENDHKVFQYGEKITSLSSGESFGDARELGETTHEVKRMLTILSSSDIKLLRISRKVFVDLIVEKEDLNLSEKFRQLQSTNIFSHCTRDILMNLARKCKNEIFHPDELIIKQGSVCKKLYIITKGYAKVNMRFESSQVERFSSNQFRKKKLKGENVDLIHDFLAIEDLANMEREEEEEKKINEEKEKIKSFESEKKKKLKAKAKKSWLLIRERMVNLKSLSKNNKYNNDEEDEIDEKENQNEEKKEKKEKKKKRKKRKENLLEITISSLASGDIFGELSIINPTKVSSINIVSEVQTNVLSISASDLFALDLHLDSMITTMLQRSYLISNPPIEKVLSFYAKRSRWESWKGKIIDDFVNGRELLA